MQWLVTGGAGYIGAHVVVALQSAGHQVRVLDDLSSGRRERLSDDVDLVVGDICDDTQARRAMKGVDGIMHLAAKKSVAESVTAPLLYYRNNVEGTRVLLAAAQQAGVERFVFTSSGAVYGDLETVPYHEDDWCQPVSPYGRTKLFGEQLVRDVAATGALTAVSLRYFNVAAAAGPDLGDHSATNLIPIALRAARDGRSVTVFGDDYPTPDGTCIRDYINVADVAAAHLAAIDLASHESPILNVGTGHGASVLEVIQAVRDVLGVNLPSTIGPRRPGDPAVSVAAVDRMAGRWTPSRSGLQTIVREAAISAGFALP